MLLKTDTPLSPQQERIVTVAIDAAVTVHRELGPGFRERIYQKAYCLEVDSRGLKFETEKPIEVKYREWLIPGQRIDLIVESVVLVEIKSVPRLRSLHRCQVISYLKTTGLRVGLLLNFNAPLMKQGLQRIVL